MATINIPLLQGTYTSYGAQGNNYSSTGYIRCGVQSSTSIRYVGHLQFESLQSHIPAGSVISQAILYVWSYSDSCYSAAQLTDVKRNTASFDAATVTYATRPATTDTNQGQASHSGYNAWFDYDITALVRDWWGGESDYGVTMIQDNLTTSVGKCFDKGGATGHAPYLHVDYIPPTAPTAPTSPSQSPNAFETTLRLSWIKGLDGTKNPITGHDVRYQTSDDGSTWSAETSISVSASVTYYDIPSATVSGWGRGKYVRFSVGSVSAYAATVYTGYSPVVRKNRAPNTPSGAPTTSKSIYAPGETIFVSFAPPNPRDPDTALTGDIAGYEAKMQDAEGTDYNSGQIVGSNASGSATSVNVATTGWAAGTQWQFFVRGYDSYGVRGDWSLPTALVMIGTPLKVLAAGSLKSVAEQKVLVGGTLKQVSEIKVLVGGALKDLTT